MASTAEPELGTAQPQLVSLSSLSPLSGLFTFLPERGISEKTVQNKSLKVYKVRPPKTISAQLERARASRKHAHAVRF